MQDPEMAALQLWLESDLTQIARRFSDRPKPKITLLIRSESVTDGSRDIMLTFEEDIELAIEAIRRLQGAGVPT